MLKLAHRHSTELIAAFDDLNGRRREFAGLPMLATLGVLSPPLREAFERRGITVERLNAVRLAAPRRRRFSRGWSQDLKLVMMGQMHRAAAAGRDEITVADFVHTLAAQPDADARLAPLGLTGTQLRAIADESD